MKKSLKQYLLDKCRQHEGIVEYQDVKDWIADLEANGEFFKLSNAERRLRDLKNEGHLERVPGKYARYKYSVSSFDTMMGNPIQKLDDLIETARKLRAEKDKNLTMF